MGFVMKTQPLLGTSFGKSLVESVSKDIEKINNITLPKVLIVGGCSDIISTSIMNKIHDLKLKFNEVGICITDNKTYETQLPKLQLKDFRIAEAMPSYDKWSKQHPPERFTNKYFDVAKLRSRRKLAKLSRRKNRNK